MKNVKIVFWIILIAFLLLVGFQNKAFFLQRHSFDLNIWVTAPYKTPEIYNAVLFAVCFVAGLVITYLSGLFERFKANKTIKQLTTTLNEQQTQAEQLRTEIEALKNVSATQVLPVDDEPQEDTTASVDAAS